MSPASGPTRPLPFPRHAGCLRGLGRPMAIFLVHRGAWRLQRPPVCSRPPAPEPQLCSQPQEPRNCTAHGSPARPQQASSIQSPRASRLVTKHGDLHAAFSQIPGSSPNCGASSWKLRPRPGLQSQGPQGLAIQGMQTSEKVKSPRLGSLKTQSHRGGPPRHWVWSPEQGCPALLGLGRGQSLP